MQNSSTNPSTAKARRRKMALTGAKKVEEDARSADYKALVHARQRVRLKPSFAAASDSEKSTMLEEAMRETMEKRYGWLAPSFLPGFLGNFPPKLTVD